jgi:tetratricopeptide (TPR) repeat protein
MALVEEELGLHGEAARSYARFLERATPDMRLQVEQARSRIPLLEAQARARRGEPLRAPAVPVVELPAVRPVAGAEPVEAATPVVIPPAPVPEVKERVPFADAIRRAQLNLNQGQAERALAFFDQALAADPANAGAWAGKAEALSRLGRHAESIAHADRALALNPRLVEVWQRRAAGYEALRRYPEALASWDGGLAVAPKSLPLLNGRGLALYYLGRLEEAEAAFEAVLALEPRHALARFNRAHVDLKVGRSAEAARGFRQFLALAPPPLGSQIADARARLAALESP